MLRQGTCDQPECGRSGKVIAKSLPTSGKWCDKCNAKRLTNGRAPARDKPKSNHPFVRKNKLMGRERVTATGEATLNRALWDSRPHVSFISGEHLGNDAKTFYFLHVLPKSTYPKFRLFDKNIVFGTLEQHTAWDHQSREPLRLRPEWDKMFALEAELKEMYNRQFRS